MRKFLVILWVVIIGGSVFIAFNLSKPKSPNDENQDNSPSQTKPTNTENSSEDDQLLSKPYEDYMKFGDNYFSDKNFEFAINNYKNAIEIEPKKTDPLVKLGQSYLKNNEPLKALEIFQKAATLAPNNLDIQLLIVQSYFNSRNFNQAKDLLIKLDQENQKVKYYTAITLVAAKQFDKAKTVFEAVRNPKNPETQDKELAENSKKFLEKYDTFSSFKEGSPLFLQTMLAKALTETEQYETSIHLLYEVIDQKTNYRDAWIVLGYAYLQTGKANDAVDALSQAELLSQNKPETLFFLGLAYFADNNLDKAIYYIEKADKNGFQPKELIELKLGDLYLLKQNYRAAAQKFDKILANNTSNLDIFTKDIWIYLENLDNAKKALELANLAITSFPESPESYNLAGWACISLEDFDQAKSFLKKALELDQNYATAYLNLGLMYEKQNSKELAEKYYKKAYTLAKGNPVGNLAKLKMNDLYKTALDKTDINNDFLKANITSP